MIATYENYHNLAIAIIGRAAMDYRSAYKRIQKAPDDRIAACEVADLRKFFLSQWFGLLSSADGEHFLRRLDKCMTTGKGKRVERGRFVRFAGSETERERK